MNWILKAGYTPACLGCPISDATAEPVDQGRLDKHWHPPHGSASFPSGQAHPELVHQQVQQKATCLLLETETCKLLHCYSNQNNIGKRTIVVTSLNAMSFSLPSPDRCVTNKEQHNPAYTVGIWNSSVKYDTQSWHTKILHVCLSLQAWSLNRRKMQEEQIFSLPCPALFKTPWLGIKQLWCAC